MHNVFSLRVLSRQMSYDNLRASSPALPCTLSSAARGQPGALKEGKTRTTQTHSVCSFDLRNNKI